MDGDYNVNNCRLSIDSIQLFTRNGMVEARVLLKMDDRIYEASQRGNTVQGACGWRRKQHCRQSTNIWMRNLYLSCLM